MRPFKYLGLLIVLSVFSNPLMAAVFTEDFSDPLGDWTTDWLYLNSNMENYYVAAGTCDPNTRGNNPSGLWVSDDRGCGTLVSASPVQINILNGFGDAATLFSIDVCGFVPSTLNVYDKDGLLDDSVAIPSDCDFPFVYANYAFNLSNGISRFEFVGGGIEGNTAIDNVSIDTTPVIGTETRATFRVTKDFTDDNPMPVEVSLSCNTGLPLDQSALVADGEANGQEFPAQLGEGAAGVAVAQQSHFTEIIFVVTNFDSGEMDCELTESVPAGYEVEYFNGATTNDVSCAYENVLTGQSLDCAITNRPAPVEVEIIKEWVIEGEGLNGVSTEYRIDLFCDSEIIGGNNYGETWHLWWIDEGDAVFTAQVLPNYPASNCRVEETVFDSAVEVDNACGEFEVSVGNGHSCTITNTVFFEGIPTLGRYGLALLVLLTLGVGLIGFRRFV
jgi:hypothetical protein